VCVMSVWLVWCMLCGVSVCGVVFVWCVCVCVVCVAIHPKHNTHFPHKHTLLPLPSFQNSTSVPYALSGSTRWFDGGRGGEEIARIQHAYIL